MNKISWFKFQKISQRLQGYFFNVPFILHKNYKIKLGNETIYIIARYEIRQICGSFILLLFISF